MNDEKDETIECRTQKEFEKLDKSIRYDFMLNISKCLKNDDIKGMKYYTDSFNTYCIIGVEKTKKR